jgi:putative transposase
MANSYTQLHIYFVFAVKFRKKIIMNSWKDELYKYITGTIQNNKHKNFDSKFELQEGYGAFSYSKSHLKNVIKYIENQEKHHTKKSFLDEYRKILDKFEVEYKEEYIFKELI